MKIVPASFEVLDHLDQQPLAARIEHCGRICYKSEDRITPESAMPFVDNVVRRGHNSVLETGTVTLEVFCQYRHYIGLLKTLPKYLNISKLRIGDQPTRKRKQTRLLITGSVRAFREMLLFHPYCALVRAMCSLLNERHPYFFQDNLAGKGLLASMPGITVRKVSLEVIDKRLPARLLSKHRHIAVKFIVNRAVSHEICRHRAMAILMESQRYCNYSADKFGNEVTFIKPLFFADESEEYAVWKRAMFSEERRYFKLLESSTPQAARTVLPNSCKTELIVYANLEQWRHIFKQRCSKAAEPSMREVMIPLRGEFTKRWPEVFGNV